jgi:hypothetical protein
MKGKRKSNDKKAFSAKKQPRRRKKKHTPINSQAKSSNKKHFF